ncbi:MAG: M28 family peptidase [Candidatus Eisenbacteria bacterium]|nr:M28 family peptidase [Candidatus Eisenbacteria bacterium]
MHTLGALLLFLTLAPAALARPALVSVDLPAKELVLRWQEMGIPTFDVFEGVAIAEVDDSTLPHLRSNGFSVRVIDADPWSDPYFVGARTHDDQNPPGRLVWQGKHTALYKIARAEAHRVFTEGLRLRELPRREISERVWNSMLQQRTLLFRQGRYPFIESLIDQVSGDSLAAYTQRLEAFRTRLMLTDSSYAATQWIADMFSSWGYPAVFDSFFVDGSWVGEFPGTGYERSVIATGLGAHTPSDHVILGGHHDSIVWPNFWDALEYAPGADDNATGVATALEAARIFRNYSWDRTIQYMAFGGEELGLFGSWDYAIESSQAGRDIRGVIGPDMIGYLDDGIWELNVCHADHAAWLAGLYAAVGQAFVPSITMYPVISYDGSDHAPFNAVGYSAIACEERWIPNNPHWHAPTDTWEQITPEYFAAAAKVCIATTAVLALFPDEVAGVEVVDMGNGADLLARWTPSAEWDIQSYRVYWRTEDGVYAEAQSILVGGASADSCVIPGLVTDETYFAVVVARDADGYESFMGVEVSATPRTAPEAPGAVVATPIRHGVALQWDANTETDVEGYRVYRRVGASTDFHTLTTEPIPQPAFIDSSLGFGEYYYVVRAFDIDGNAGAPSAEAFARPITLDQGILVVDETRNYTTLPDVLQDDFYRYIMEGSNFTEYEYGVSEEKPRLADLAPFSSIVWHAEDFAEFFASGSTGDLRQYLDAGGNLWLVGWKPTADLTNDATYPKDFGPGSFVHDYLKVSRASLSGIADAVAGARGLLGYPDLAVEADSIPVPSWNGTLRYVEAYTATVGEPVYLVDAQDDQNPFDGGICGVRYLGTDFRTMVLGIPLYHMGREQARTTARQVLRDFGEPLAGEQAPDGAVAPREIRLLSVAPNPCSAELSVRYALSHSGHVRVTLFDLAGREIIRLVDDTLPKGVHIVTSPLGAAGSKLGAGVYLCRLAQGGLQTTRKVVLMP